jgi:hypothetical protein
MPYFRIGGIILLITGASHLVGHFFLVPQFQLIHKITDKFPANATEKELLVLMTHYHKTVGGAPMSMMDIQNGLSLCYALLLLWSGSLSLILYKPIRRNHRLLTTLSFLYAGMLFIGLIISLIFFFWLPVASFASAFLFFLLSGILFSRSQQF